MSEMEENRQRHCWECLRRCLVCDFTRPACKRCSASGTACPGYGESKPSRLRWLPPGTVTSRKRRPRAMPDKTENSNHETATGTASDPPRISGNAVIPRFEMRTEACVLAQAAEYYNTCIYQDLMPIHELGQNPYVYTVSPMQLRAATMLPDFLQLGMVCMTLSHRMNRTRNEPWYEPLAETFYQYRGNAIRSLNNSINVDHQFTADIIIAGIMTLLLIDAQQGASSGWRCHIEGIQKLITLRGGIHSVARSKTIEPLLLSFVSIGVIGNTTSPASDLAMTGSHLDELDFIIEQFGGAISPFQMCPPTLFAEIIRINHLRTQAAKHDPTTPESLAQEAYRILGRVHDFPPEQWSETKPSSKEDWILIANIYQAAVALYCILSLQSLSVLPLSSSLRAKCVMRGQLLHSCLNEALSSPRVKRFMIWPLVVLGVEAVHGGLETRTFVQKQLLEMSRHAGTYVPLTAKGVLERFWTSSETGWDSCFDKPYAFTTQIAVDTSRILRVL